MLRGVASGVHRDQGRSALRGSAAGSGTVGADDPYVVGGTVTLAGPGGCIAANLVCERSGDRLVWSALQFRASGFASARYDLGPIDRTHGFTQSRFIEQRTYMLRTAMHIWSVTTTTLTPDVLLRFLRSAIDLS
jgi:hypothetical protein